jgi:hypothetical protein
VIVSWQMLPSKLTLSSLKHESWTCLDPSIDQV